MTATPTKPPESLRVRASLSRHALIYLFALLVIVLAIVSPNFRDADNLLNVLEQNAIIGIVACGMLLMILLGGFDLSVGAVGALSTVVAAWTMASSGIFVGVLAAIGAGVLVGLFNGVLIAKVGINPFVVTLGMQVLVTGLLYVWTDAKPVYGVPDSWSVVGLGRINGTIPIAAVIFAVVAVLTWLMLRYTTFGHHIYAVGGNAEASRLAGIRGDRITVLVYALGAMAAAVAGLVLIGQTSIGQPNAATTWPLAAIAAVVVGGVPLSGGVGGVGGAVIGTLLLGTITNALNQFGVSPYWQPAITGAVILTAVGLDQVQRRRGTRTAEGKNR